MFDLWVHAWRRKVARGAVVVVRYADEVVVGFQHRQDAERFQQELQNRLAKFGLELNAEKTRLVEFGRWAERDRRRRGKGKPETFDFLGFTHYCGKHRKGYFCVWRKTTRKRLATKLRLIKQQLRVRRHEPIPQVGEWLQRVVTGYYNYHAVPGNLASLSLFQIRLSRLWRQTLRRQGDKRKMDWKRFQRVCGRYLPPLRTQHPYPYQRFDVTHPR